MRIAFFIFCICVLSGCANVFTGYKYSVRIKNIGTMRIYVPPFDFYDTEMIGAGRLPPNIDKTSGPYFQIPYSTVNVKWYLPTEDTPYGKGFSQTVKIDLPKEFTPSHGQMITFYIDPDENKVDVSYEIRTEFNEDKEINSDGSRFQLPKTPKKKLSQKE